MKSSGSPVLLNEDLCITWVLLESLKPITQIIPTREQIFSDTKRMCVINRLWDKDRLWDRGRVIKKDYEIKRGYEIKRECEKKRMCDKKRAWNKERVWDQERMWDAGCEKKRRCEIKAGLFYLTSASPSDKLITMSRKQRLLCTHKSSCRKS